MASTNSNDFYSNFSVINFNFANNNDSDLDILTDFGSVPPTAQRLALPASGRAWILFESRKNSKPENYRKSRRIPLVG
jgi:hypothetical protein